MAPADTLRELYQMTDPMHPLPGGDPLYVPLEEARTSAATANLKQRIEGCSEGQFASIAFGGHKGTGKSTELLQLQNELGASCFCLHLDVADYLDASDVDYTDLFLLLSRVLLERLRERGIQLDGGLLQEVEGWFSSVTKETEESLKLSAGVGVEARASAGFPYIARLLAKLTADIKAGSSLKQTTRAELDRYFSGLLGNTNALLAAASEALSKAGQPSRILVVFDQLDRLPPEVSEKLFFHHGPQLQDLKCHTIYTVSIDTFYSRNGLGHVFPRHEFLPNVKLCKGKTDVTGRPEGIEAMREVMLKRMNTRVLLNPPKLAGELIRLSGGSVRQLVRLLQEATISARERNEAAIDAIAVKDAARHMQQDFQRMLEPKHYGILARTAENKTIEKDADCMLLLRTTAILEYNGTDLWYDVNPLIEQIDAYQDARKPGKPAKPGKRR